MERDDSGRMACPAGVVAPWGVLARKMKMSDYEVLKKAGHSPAKAFEIALDAKRGCKDAARWIEILRKQTPENLPGKA